MTRKKVPQGHAIQVPREIQVHTYVSPASPDDLRRARALGMPADAELSRWQVRGQALGAEWDGYAFDVFGRLIPYRSGPYKFPVWAEGERKLTQVWQIGVAADGCPIVGQLIWNPEQGTTMNLLGLEQPHTQEDLLKIDRGLAYVFERCQPGHPTGSGNYPSRELFLADLHNAIRQLLKQGVKIEPDLIIPHMAVGRSAFFTTARRFNVSWPAEVDAVRMSLLGGLVGLENESE